MIIRSKPRIRRPSAAAPAGPFEVEVVVGGRRGWGSSLDVVAAGPQPAHLLHGVGADPVPQRRVRRDDEDPLARARSCGQPLVEGGLHAVERDRPGVVLEHVVAARLGQGPAPRPGPRPRSGGTARARRRRRRAGRRRTARSASARPRWRRLAMTGVPASHASMTMREKLSRADGWTYAAAAAMASSRSSSERNPRSTTRSATSTGGTTSPTPKVTRWRSRSSLRTASANPSSRCSQPLAPSRRPP